MLFIIRRIFRNTYVFSRLIIIASVNYVMSVIFTYSTIVYKMQ